MNEEKISVITPMYNALEYLPRYFESMLGQTYKNIEIVIVDDGSTDGSGELCDEYASKDPRIKVYHPGHQGVIKTRAYGAEKATGDYVGFVDADDWAEPDQFEYLYTLLKKHNADIAQCGYFEDGPNRTKICYAPKKDIVANKPFNKRQWQLYHTALWNKLFRREIMPPFTTDERFVLGEDAINCILLYNNAKTVIFGSKPKYHYLINEGSICTDKAPDKKVLIRHFLAIDSISELIKDEPVAVEHFKNEYISTAIWIYGRIAKNNYLGAEDIEKKARTLVLRNIFRILFSGDFRLRHILVLPVIVLGKKTYYRVYALYKKLRG